LAYSCGLPVYDLAITLPSSRSWLYRLLANSCGLPIAIQLVDPNLTTGSTASMPLS
jgi:hypothetical protein